MNIENAIQHAIEGKAILFAGSGFSYGAKNVLSESFKSGIGLRDHLAELCNAQGTSSNLSTVADYYIDLNNEESLVDILKEQFTVKAVAPHHDDILSINWKRIYTTNYDDVIETASVNKGVSMSSVVMSDNLDYINKESICVHLNGSINRVNNLTLNREFKLTDSSYDSEVLKGQPWFDFMERDFASAKVIIVIGFSMQSDIDITRILSAPKISDKIIFVTKPNLDPISKNRLSKYAPVEEIGVEGFAAKLIELKSIYKESVLSDYEFTSFIHENMTPVEPEEIGLTELTQFYYNGKYSDCFLEKNRFGEYINVVNRSAVELFIRERNNYRVFLATSSLGNGKSVFCDLVRNELRESDVNVFTLQSETVDLDFDIEEICSYNKRVVVIIDDYYKHIDKLKRFRDYGIDNITFVLTSRQSKLANNYRKLVRALNIEREDIRPLYLHKMKEDECSQLAEILHENKLTPSKLDYSDADELSDVFINDCECSISNIVLELFKSSLIKSKLEDLINSAIKDENKDIQELTVLALSNSVMNFSLTFTEMLSLFNINFFKSLLNESVVISELFDIKSDNLEVRSSIVARELLYSIISAELLKSVLRKLVISADKSYRTNKKYEELLKAIVSHTNFLPITRGKNAKNISQVKHFYDSIRNTNFCKDNPFYWEQFAAVCIDSRDYITATQCIENAYSCAKSIRNFVPFQISTINADLIVSSALNDLICCNNFTKESVSNVFVKAHDLLTKHYQHEENDKYHVFRTSRKLVTLFNNSKSLLDRRSISIYIEKLTDLTRRLEEFQSSGEGYLYPHTTEIHKSFVESINKAKQMLKNT